MAETFRLNSVLELNPLFISLGLPNHAFKSFNPAVPLTFFDAVVNAGTLHPDDIWLFKGADYHRYNLRERKFVGNNRPISEFAKSGTPPLPAGFFNGVDTVVYGGSAFPNRYVFFAEETYVGINASVAVNDSPEDPAQSHWNADEGPRGVLGAWAVGVWTNPDGTFTKPGTMAGLHGEGSSFTGQVHFFRNGMYVRHDMRTGRTAAGPMPIKDVWKLRSPFAEQIDLAFYGVGSEAQKIYFFSGADFVLYDPELAQIIRDGKVVQEFPGFASFMTRPQLFLVEQTQLRTYLGPLQDGILVDNQTLGPGATQHYFLLIETVDISSTTLQSSVLDQQDVSSVKNLDDRVNKQTSEDKVKENYKFHLQAAAHGDASASGFWGGEVNANVAVQGGSDTNRLNFASSVFNAVSSQVTESTRQQVARTLTRLDDSVHQERVLSTKEYTLRNSKDHIVNFGFFNILQSVVGLLVLTNVRIAYSDGFNPRVVELRELPQLLDDVLAPTQSKDVIIQYVTGELSRITDAKHQERSLLSDGSTGLAVNPGLVTAFPIDAPDGSVQTVSVQGIVKLTKSFINPTQLSLAREL